jgi:hypothetical protein
MRARLVVMKGVQLVVGFLDMEKAKSRLSCLFAIGDGLSGVRWGRRESDWH